MTTATLNEICAYAEILRLKRERGLKIDPSDYHCLHCSGYPDEEGCFKYTTKGHIEQFYRLLKGGNS